MPWFRQNFELIILVFTVLGVIIAWRQLRKKEPPAARTVTQSPTITVNPTFNLSQATIAPGELDKKSAVAEPLSAEGADDGRPELHSLEPRICFVVAEGDGFIEGGETVKAVLATFRMKKPSSDRRGTHVTARLSYKTQTNAKEFGRVNHGAWVDEDFNSATFTLTNTKELILAMGAGEEFVAVQDNRHNPNQQKEPSYFAIDSDEFFVNVNLVDEIFGSLTAFTYKIRIKHLKVEQIRRFPR